MTTLHAFDFLANPGQQACPPALVLFGDELFLKQQALRVFRRSQSGDDDLARAEFDGELVEWGDVHDELATRSLFGGEGPRIVTVVAADDFVTRYRGQLEEYLDRPRVSSVLVLNVETWASNTRLYKINDRIGLQVDCRAPTRTSGKNKYPDFDRIAKWLESWADSHHEIRLPAACAKLVVELAGKDIGILNQELAKLALFAGRSGTVTNQMVQDVVGGWRVRTSWELIDAALDGNAAEALARLGKMLQAGEHPNALFGSISWSLRRFAAATRVLDRAEREGRRIQVADALKQAGVFGIDAQRQFERINRGRGRQLYRWLLQLDLALKRTHSDGDGARFALEQLIFRLSGQLAPQP